MESPDPFDEKPDVYPPANWLDPKYVAWTSKSEEDMGEQSRPAEFSASSEKGEGDIQFLLDMARKDKLIDEGDGQYLGETYSEVLGNLAKIIRERNKGLDDPKTPYEVFADWGILETRDKTE